MSIEAMKQALGFLEHLRSHDKRNLYGLDEDITALRTAIEQAEKPVCEVLNERGEVDYISYVPPAGTLLYAAPGQWVGLTDEEIDSLDLPPSGTATVRDLVRLIEKAIMEKNDVLRSVQCLRRTMGAWNGKHLQMPKAG